MLSFDDDAFHGITIQLGAQIEHGACSKSIVEMQAPGPQEDTDLLMDQQRGGNEQRNKSTSYDSHQVLETDVLNQNKRGAASNIQIEFPQGNGRIVVVLRLNSYNSLIPHQT